MARKIIDCATHLAVVHDMPDTAEVRAYVRSMLKDEPQETDVAASSGGARG